MGWNPTQGMDVYVRLFCVRQRPCDGPIPARRSPTVCVEFQETEKRTRPNKGMQSLSYINDPASPVEIQRGLYLHP
jgi:hypothetical protein